LTVGAAGLTDTSGDLGAVVIFDVLGITNVEHLATGKDTANALDEPDIFEDITGEDETGDFDVDLTVEDLVSEDT